MSCIVWSYIVGPATSNQVIHGINDILSPPIESVHQEKVSQLTYTPKKNIPHGERSNYAINTTVQKITVT